MGVARAVQPGQASAPLDQAGWLGQLRRHVLDHLIANNEVPVTIGVGISPERSGKILLGHYPKPIRIFTLPDEGWRKMPRAFS